MFVFFNPSSKFQTRKRGLSFAKFIKDSLVKLNGTGISSLAVSKLGECTFFNVLTIISASQWTLAKRLSEVSIHVNWWWIASLNDQTDLSPVKTLIITLLSWVQNRIVWWTRWTSSVPKETIDSFVTTAKSYKAIQLCMRCFLLAQSPMHLAAPQF